MLWPLLAVLSAALAIIGLAGAALTPLIVPHDVPPPENATRRLAEAVATPMLAGVLIAYTLLLIFGRFEQMALVAATVAVLGAARLAVFGRHGPRAVRPSRGAFVAFAALVLPLVLIGVSAAFTPIEAWDARSIWFFHAKIMTTLHGLIDDPAWRAPENAFSSPMHPKLLPAVGAVVPAVLGVWNEYLPKAGLVILAAPALVAALSFSTGRFTEWFLVVTLFFAFGSYLTNGMADGYFAVYATLAALFAARFLDEDTPGDGARAFLCFGIAGSLKSEGMLLALALALTFLTAVVLRRRRSGARLAHAVAAILALSPMVLWSLTKSHWGIAWATHLNFGNVDSDLAARMLGHIAELPLIFDWMFLRSGLWRYAALAAGAVVAGGLYLRRIPPAAGFMLVAAALYFVGMAAIYTATNIDVATVLDFSADRTTIAVASMLLAATYIMLDRAIAGRRNP